MITTALLSLISRRALTASGPSDSRFMVNLPVTGLSNLLLMTQCVVII